MGKAHITDPEILRIFRGQYVKFTGEARQALGAIRSDVTRVGEWLRRDQAAHWKKQLRRREDKVQSCRLELIRATQADHYHGKNSGVDERKALDRAQNAVREAEEKIQLVKRWAQILDQETQKQLSPCINLSTLLDSLEPKALARLDRMMDSLDAYMRPSAPTSAPGSSAGTTTEDGTTTGDDAHAGT